LIFIKLSTLRQTINNLEATYYGYTKITESNVYKLCYQPHPNTIIALIQKCASKNIKLAIIKYFEELIELLK
jgi:replication factor C subunit 2/4